jgi:hypothetical protein
MKRKSSRAVALVFASLSSTACSPDQGEPELQLSVTPFEGGIAVEIGSARDIVTTPWQVAEEFNTGPDSAPLELFQVVGGRFLADGSLAVANSGTQEILIFGSNGRLIRRFGRSGEGPGEFQTITSLDLDDAGNLVAYDARLARLSTWTREGA